MVSIVLNGRDLAKENEIKLAKRVSLLTDKNNGIVPKLATILVGDDPASETYVNMKANACSRVGMESIKIKMSETTTTKQLLATIEELNADKNVHGILLQHPVPAQIDERICFNQIDPAKDVDGVTSLGFGRMSMGEAAYGCATPKGIMTLLEENDISISGKHAVVVGRSPILGKPMAMMLLEANATVTICHSKTESLPSLVRQADIIIGALGKPEFIKSDWIKDGAVVVDAGYHPGGIGDIELGEDLERYSAYTPVPGGVGPMTINTLITQTVESAEKSI